MVNRIKIAKCCNQTLTTKHTKHSALLALALYITIFSGQAQSISVKQCQAHAKTPLEKSYCEILRSNTSVRLPDFYQFRNNPEKTQRLLLRRPARELGITLPEEKNISQTKDSRRTPAPQISSSQVPSLKTEQRTTQQTPRPESTVDSTTHAETSSTPLQGCRLERDQILCHNSRYFLVINIPFHRLPPYALSDENRMKLDSDHRGQSVSQYLSRLYPQYIEKMLAIGLGDSTVSYTKFTAIYEQSQQQKEDFSARFEKMYELLKNERKTLAVKQRYQNNFPEKIEQCMQLNAKLISCDNIAQNWVYQKLGAL